MTAILVRFLKIIIFPENLSLKITTLADLLEAPKEKQMSQPH